MPSSFAFVALVSNNDLRNHRWLPADSSSPPPAPLGRVPPAEWQNVCLEALTIFAKPAAADGLAPTTWFTDEATRFAATRELEVTIVALCAACRDGSARHVRVTHDNNNDNRGTVDINNDRNKAAAPALLSSTPPHLWHIDDSAPLHRIETSRIPAFEVRELTFRDTITSGGILSLDSEICNVIALPQGLERLTLGLTFNLPIDGMVFPPCLRRLVFGNRFNQPVGGVFWPALLEELVFGSDFNKPIHEARWPKSLKRLTFGRSFNQPSGRPVSFRARIRNVSREVRNKEPVSVPPIFPDSLQELTFGRGFNRSLNRAAFPSSLQRLSFGLRFNRSLTRVTWPPSLQHLILGDSFDGTLDGIEWPPLLRELSLPGGANQPFGRGSPLPDSLEHLTHGGFVNGHMNVRDVVWPASLLRLTFTKHFNQPIDRYVWPPSLRELTFGDGFNQPIPEGIAWPETLERLRLGRKFDHPIDHVVLPDSLKTLTLGRYFSQSLPSVQERPGLDVFVSSEDVLRRE